jgi:hypothetical protein
MKVLVAETKIGLCVALANELGADDIKAAKELSDDSEALKFAEMYVRGAKHGLQIHTAKMPDAQARLRNAGRDQLWVLRSTVTVKTTDTTLALGEGSLRSKQREIHVPLSYQLSPLDVVSPD